MEKIRIMLTGYGGRMGQAITEAVDTSNQFIINVGVDINPLPINTAFPVFFNPSDYSGEVDAVLDFSHHTAVYSILEYAQLRGIPAVIATTGHNVEEIEAIKQASSYIPVFKTANMSIGVNLIAELAKKAAVLLDGFDIEIIEAHHNQKLDAPSGTALLIADRISETRDNSDRFTYIYDRHNVRKTRGKNEIGIHTVRGGSIIGEHEVIFAGRDEVIKLSHSALSREMFAYGALSAVRYIIDKPTGLYSMSDLMNSNI